MIFTTRVQDGDLVSVDGLIVNGPSGWSDSFGKDAQSFWIADSWYPFAKEPFVRVVASPPDGYDVAHVYGRVHWEKGKAILYPAEVKSAWHSWEWWLAHKEEIEAWWAELVESPAYSISAGDSATGVAVQSLLDNPPSEPPTNTIAHAKWQSDGESEQLTGKVVSAGTDWFSGCIYVQEPGRSCGIRVNTSGSFASGDVVSVSGTMGTASGERVILNAIVEKTDTTDAPIPLTLNNRTTGGGPFLYDEGPPERGQKGVIDDAETPKPSFGLNNIGLLVRTTGKITAIDPSTPATWFKIDDGSAVSPKIAYSPGDMAVDNYVVVTGISSCEISGNNLLRVIRPGSAEDVTDISPLTVTINQAAGQADPTSGTPINFTVVFSEPVSDFTDEDVTLSGTAGATTATVTGSGTTYNVAVSGMTNEGTVVATVEAGVAHDSLGFSNGQSTSTDNTVHYIGDIVYVRPAADGGNDSNNGWSWANAKATIQAGLDTAASYQQHQVWVARGLYNERITLRQGVALYGGFAGTETVLNERPGFQRQPPDANETIVDGNKLGSVVTVPSGATATMVIDGFTIRNGTGTTVSSSTYGGGIYCATGSATIANNKVMWNTASDAGGGIYFGGGCPTIVGNIITGNEASYHGGGIRTVSGATITNNIITANGANNGGGVSTGDATIQGNTIAANDGREGGGISCTASAVVKANIVAYNCSGIYNISISPTLTVDYNCFYENCFYDQRYVAYGQGNIFAAPLLVGISHDTVRNMQSSTNMHIQGNSPCVNAVSDGSLLGTTDIDGQMRPIGEYPDIGADESDGSYYAPTSTVVRVDGVNGNDNNDGSSWSMAKQTIQAAIDAAATNGGDVWVKRKGTPYAERITLRPFVYLFGSCTGNETSRPVHTQVGWGTDLDGQSQGGVVTIRGGYRVNLVEAFDVKNGYVSGNGAGIFCSNASPVLRYNAIYGNIASGSSGLGGGIYCFLGAPEIERNEIGRSSAPNRAYGGGGIKTYLSVAKIARNSIRYNVTSYEGGGISAAASVAHGTVLMENNYVDHNSAQSYGSGLSISGSGSHVNALIVAYNTITNNTSSSPPYSWWGGGGIYLSSPNWALIANNIVASNRDGIWRSGGSLPTLTRNCVWNNGTDYSNVNHPTDINVDPKIDYLWRIRSDSPCRNVASTDYATAIDIDGEARPMGGQYDIGADEFTE